MRTYGVFRYKIVMMKLNTREQPLIIWNTLAAVIVSPTSERVVARQSNSAGIQAKNLYFRGRVFEVSTFVE